MENRYYSRPAMILGYVPVAGNAKPATHEVHAGKGVTRQEKARGPVNPSEQWGNGKAPEVPGDETTARDPFD